MRIRLLRSTRDWLLLCLGSLSVSADAQDTLFARRVIEDLCSRSFAGRGYVHDGALKAAGYLEKQLKQAGVQPWKGSYAHPFSMAVNTIPVASVKLQGKSLKAGEDFLVDPASSSWKGNLTLRLWSWNDTLSYPEGPWMATEATAAIPEAMFRHSLWGKRVAQLLQMQPVPVWVMTVEHLPAWSVAGRPVNTTGLIVRASLPLDASQMKLDIRNDYHPQQLSHNVLGYIPGTRVPDSLLVLTAHYDHLGRMGKAIFPGANDNAAGVAMVLDFAREAVKRPLPYSVAVVFFSGEEAGLLGSAALVRDRILPLERIRFLLNLDLVGTGETGMTVVNATVFPEEFSLLDSLNRQYGYLPSISRRGKAANSDHYYFSESGVPAFFGYLGGPRPSYHAIDDVPQTLTLHGYVHTYRLYRRFLEQIAGLK